jgi:ABC-type Fe3+/spermidine/putrescine transport system ATPase subunit
MDEPLGALDRKLRAEMQLEIRRIQKKLKITTVYVTHDQEEALTISDRIAVMRDGNIEQVARPHELYAHPRTAFVADFVGDSNLFFGRVSGDGDAPVIETFEGDVFALPRHTDELPTMGAPVGLLIRPEDVAASGAPSALCRYRARIEDQVYLGAATRLHLATPSGRRVMAAVKPDLARSLGSAPAEVWFGWAPEIAVLVPGAPMSPPEARRPQ